MNSAPRDAAASWAPRARKFDSLAARAEPVDTDRDAVRAIVESTGFFRADEVDVAVELVDERLKRGVASGYHFLFADDPSHASPRPLAYACFGPIACTIASYDLHWIAVQRDHRHGGLGSWLLEKVERTVTGMGGQRLYIETSRRSEYAATRAFYERHHYASAAVLDDFYGPGDDKVIYVKALPQPEG